MKSRWKLNEAGFVTNYMISGPRVTPFETLITDPNQLQFEKSVRREAVTAKPLLLESTVCPGKQSGLGEAWKPYYLHGSWFVDVSNFYSLLQRVEFEAAVVLEAEQDLEVSAVLWTYLSVGVYCNGVLVGEQKYPDYKPIRRLSLTLPLKKGKNSILLLCQTLGVRDTRSIVGLQITDHLDEIGVSLFMGEEEHDEIQNYETQIYEAAAFLDGLSLKNGRVCFQTALPPDVCYCYENMSEDYKEEQKPLEWNWISGPHSSEVREKELVLKEGERLICVGVNVTDPTGENVLLKRTLENTEAYQPMYSPKGIGVEENFQLIMKRIASVYSLSRGERFGFAISNILARTYLGESLAEDEALLWETLDLIEQRVDCSDFLMCGIIRYLHNNPINEKMSVRCKEVLLNYRYWMDMDGRDAMCFWSENHSLMFYASAMEVGVLYPDDWFPRAKMTGKALSEYGRDKVLQWIADVEKYGFEEFLSTVYMCVTLAALLNVVDYSDDEISGRARVITDRLFDMLALHTFDGAVIAPMGRVYREVLYPFGQGAQALMNLVNPEVPYSYGEGWLAFLATSSYRPQEGLKERMEQSVSVSYETGNAKIVLEKQKNYCLTSVRSPREAEFVRWKNVEKDPKMDRGTHEYNKSLNECFHGTTCFEPGVYGYQQHMWYAALDKEAVIFTNHPGVTSEGSGMRPGYWNGNERMPAMKQEKNEIGIIYVMKKEDPIWFTHLYCPKARFDEVIEEDGWLFFRKKSGVMALWCSGRMDAYNEMLPDCERRVYGEKTAYYCLCSDLEKEGSMDAFQKRAKEQQPLFDKEQQELSLRGERYLQYIECCDETQFID